MSTTMGSELMAQEIMWLCAEKLSAPNPTIIFKVTYVAAVHSHKDAQRTSLHWVIIPCYEIQKLRLVTELYTQKWSDNLFAQVVYLLLHHHVCTSLSFGPPRMFSVISYKSRKKIHEGATLSWTFEDIVVWCDHSDNEIHPFCVFSWLLNQHNN